MRASRRRQLHSGTESASPTSSIDCRRRRKSAHGGRLHFGGSCGPGGRRRFDPSGFHPFAASRTHPGTGEQIRGICPERSCRTVNQENPAVDTRHRYLAWINSQGWVRSAIFLPEAAQRTVPYVVPTSNHKLSQTVVNRGARKSPLLARRINTIANYRAPSYAVFGRSLNQRVVGSSPARFTRS